MKRMKESEFDVRPFGGLRFRVLLTVVFAFLPAFALILFSALGRRKDALDDARRDADRLSQIIVREHAHRMDETRQLLSLLSTSTEVKGNDWEACGRLFRDILPEMRWLANLIVVDGAGNLVVSAVPYPGPLNVADRSYFQRAVQSREFSVGDYFIGRITGKPLLVFAQPVLDERGEVDVVLVAAWDLEWLEEFAAGLELPPGSVLQLVDSRGIVLVRYPDGGGYEGCELPEEPVVKNMLEGPGSGSVHAEGLDGVRRLYVHKTLMGGEETGKVYVCVGFSEKEISGPVNRALAVDLAYMGLFVVLVLFLTYWLSGFFILMPIRNLLRASRELGEGNLAARTGLGDAVGEIGLLARSFDRMAESLQARSEERDRAEEELRKSRERLSVIVDTVPVGIIIFDGEGRVTFANPSVEGLFGLARGEILGSFHDRLFSEMADVDGNPVRREELPFLRVMREKSELLDLEYSVICRDGSRKMLSFNAAPLRDEKGDIAGVIASVEDVTERNAARSRTERLGRFYAVLSEVNRAVVHFRGKGALFDEICRILVDKGLFNTAWIEMVDPSTGILRPVAHAGMHKEYVEGIKKDVDEGREGRNPSEMVVREGRPLVCNDIENDPRMAPWRDKALASGYRSYGAFPLRCGAGGGGDRIHQCVLESYRLFRSRRRTDHGGLGRGYLLCPGCHGAGKPEKGSGGALEQAQPVLPESRRRSAAKHGEDCRDGQGDPPLWAGQVLAPGGEVLFPHPRSFRIRELSTEGDVSGEKNTRRSFSLAQRSAGIGKRQASRHHGKRSGYR